MSITESVICDGAIVDGGGFDLVPGDGSALDGEIVVERDDGEIVVERDDGKIVLEP